MLSRTFFSKKRSLGYIFLEQEKAEKSLPFQRWKSEGTIKLNLLFRGGSYVSLENTSLKIDTYIPPIGKDVLTYFINLHFEVFHL